MDGTGPALRLYRVQDILEGAAPAADETDIIVVCVFSPDDPGARTHGERAIRARLLSLGDDLLTLECETT